MFTHTPTRPLGNNRSKARKNRQRHNKNRTLKDAVRVNDVLGNVVLSSPTYSAGTPSEGGHIRLDVAGLAAGVYFIRVGGKMYKFVKM